MRYGVSGVILAFLASIHRIVYGSSLLFVYAAGHCALTVRTGVFTGVVESYAKSKGVGDFSALTKKISGVLIFLGGLYILYLNV